MKSCKRFIHIGMALDPIHVGSGGSRIGRVDLTIVREPATRLPKIPGSSLAGVYRTYVAMDFEAQRAQVQSQASTQQPSQAQRQKAYYPDCAGQGQPRPDGTGGHCGKPDCPVCVVFGFARGKDQAGGFAGLAAFSDAQVLLFPVPTRKGPYWVTCPMALGVLDLVVSEVQDNAVYLGEALGEKLNLGWLYLEVKRCDGFQMVKKRLESLRRCENLGVPKYIEEHLAILPDKLFSHVVNSNLEVRTSVSINPETGAAEEGALFSYEALPRSTVLVWDLIAKNPCHFKVAGKDVNAECNGEKIVDPDKVHQVVEKAHPYLEHLGIGGMGTRGMGRLKVIFDKEAPWVRQKVGCESPERSVDGGTQSETTEEEEGHEST